MFFTCTTSPYFQWHSTIAWYEDQYIFVWKSVKNRRCEEVLFPNLASILVQEKDCFEKCIQFFRIFSDINLSINLFCIFKAILKKTGLHSTCSFCKGEQRTSSPKVQSNTQVVQNNSKLVKVFGKYFKLRLSPAPLSKKSIFAKKIEIEINWQGDSPCFALSETLLLFFPQPILAEIFDDFH